MADFLRDRGSDYAKTFPLSSQGFERVPRDSSIDLSGVDIGEELQRCSAAGL